MIRITIEKIKWGIGEPETLGIIKIWNDGTGTKSKGNYGYRIMNRRGLPHKAGEVKGFPRLQQSAVRLLHWVLNSAFGEK